MFANFDKSFKRNNKKLSIPSEIIASLSENLPHDFKYVDIGDGFCAIQPNTSKAHLSVAIEMPSEFKPKSTQELIEFMYRAQCELRIIPDKEGYITINGSRILLNDLIAYPLGEDPGKGAFFIRAEPFLPPFKLKLEGGGVVKDILVQRRPYPHMDKSLFKSTDDSVIEISYVLDEVTQTIKFNFGINIEKSHSASEIIENLKLYQACVAGRAFFAGMDISTFKSAESDEILSKTIEFWGKIETLEEELQVSFNVDFPITDEDALWIEKLYKSFIEDKAYKEYVKIDKIKTVTKTIFDTDGIINLNELMFGYIQKSDLTIWGVTLVLYGVVAMYDLKVTEVVVLDKEANEYELIVESVEAKRMYISTRHFLDKTDAEEFFQKYEELKSAELLVG